jgi:hypothetical protein
VGVAQARCAFANIDEGSVSMKRISVGLLLLMLFSVAVANDEPVPAGTLLTALPEGSRILIKKNILPGTPVMPGSAVFSQKLYGEMSGVLTYPGALAFIEGMQFPVSKIVPSNSSLSLHFGTSDVTKQITFFRSDGIPQTVGDFDSKMGAHFSIIYDDPAYDPYPGMDKSVVVDIVMKKITAGLKENNPAKTLPQFAYLEKLGVPLPESFSYYYTETLEKAGKKDAARTHAAAYLKAYGKKGKYYAQVIEIMSRL